MKKAIVLTAASLLLLAVPQPVWAKPAVVVVQPEGSQTSIMENGSQIITSELPGSIVVMRTPEPFEGGRTGVFFTFINKGKTAVNVGPENITSAQIAVVSYDKLMAEQKSSEGWDKFTEVLQGLNNLQSASRASRQSNLTITNGYLDCGILCGANYSSVSRTYDPNAARQARLQAEAQNRAAAAAMHADHAAARSAIGANLRTTTVLPGHFITGMLTFEVPKKVRRGKQASPMALYIRVGSDVHVIKGYAGAVGTTPPPAIAASSAKAVAPRVSSPAASSSTSVGAQDAYARAEALYYGRGVQQDFAAAANWYRKAAIQGHAKAQHNLGALYHYGQGVPEDFAIAASWYRKAAAQGLAGAQYNLGHLYYRGQGFPQDFAMAASLYRRAADQGVPQAQYSLGIMYENGQGVPRDLSTAASWYHKAADQGHASAQHNLGVMYQRGRGVARDAEVAKSWYQKAANQGHSEAKKSLSLMK